MVRKEKRNLTETEFEFRRLNNAEDAPAPRSLSLQPLSSQDPQSSRVSSIILDEDPSCSELGNKTEISDAKKIGPRGEAPSPHHVSGQGLGSVRPLHSRREPRRFHLTKAPPVSKLRETPLYGGMNQRNGRAQESFAVFVEKQSIKHGATISQPKIAAGIKDSINVSGGSASSYNNNAVLNDADAAKDDMRADEPGTPRDLTLTEIAAASEANETDQDPQHLQLAKELQEFALQVSEREAIPSIDPPASRGKPIATSSPTPLLKPHHDGHSTMLDDNDAADEMMIDVSDGQSNDGDWVYDTFVRQAMPSANLEAHSVGLLIIAKEEEQLWEAYGENDANDWEFDTEDEDENGMVSAQHGFVIKLMPPRC